MMSVLPFLLSTLACLANNQQGTTIVLAPHDEPLFHAALAKPLTMFDSTLNLPDKTKILFQGDSITDMNRGRNNDPNHILGHSYAFLIAARAGASNPERGYEFINRGVSGDRIASLTARWKSDALDLKPDILSILAGINDILASTPTAEFEKSYDALLQQTRHELPNVQLVLCEPFGLPTGWRKDQWQTTKPRLDEMQQVVQSLAKKYNAIFVPLQAAFDKATKRAPAEHWIWDSIHPTYSGQQLLADEWCRVVNKEFNKRQR